MIYPWQTKQWQQLHRQHTEQRLPHALLLTGQPGLGKWAFAQAVAASLLCDIREADQACGQCAACQLLAAGTHPDYLPVLPEAEDRAIKVDDIRDLSRNLSLTSQMGGYKVAVIGFADNMNINAANSLLKTLEEPTDNTVLILVSARPQRLPVTIRSRCQVSHFPPPASEDALQWLSEQGLQDAEALLRLAHGSPLLAQTLAEDDSIAQRKALMQALVGGGRGSSLLDAAAELAKWPLEPLLGWLYDWICDVLRYQQQPAVALVHQDYREAVQGLADNVPPQALYAYLDQLLQVKTAQSIPLNSQMLWEDLLLSWERLITSAKTEG